MHTLQEDLEGTEDQRYNNLYKAFDILREKAREFEAANIGDCASWD